MKKTKQVVRTNEHLLKKIQKLREKENHIYQYDLLTHPLLKQKIVINNNEFTIVNIFKKWNWGWYYAAEIQNKNFAESYICLPYQNISCLNKEIIEKIELFSKYFNG